MVKTEPEQRWSMITERAPTKKQTARKGSARKSRGTPGSDRFFMTGVRTIGLGCSRGGLSLFRGILSSPHQVLSGIRSGQHAHAPEACGGSRFCCCNGNGGLNSHTTGTLKCGSVVSSNILGLLRPQSRFGDKPLELNVFCPRNGTGVLKGLRYRFYQSAGGS